MNPPVTSLHAACLLPIRSDVAHIKAGIGEITAVSERQVASNRTEIETSSVATEQVSCATAN